MSGRVDLGLVFGDDLDDPFRCGFFSIVDMFDARGPTSDCLELLNSLFAVLERDAKCFWICEQNGLEFVKLKIGNESEMIDVTLERFLQGQDIGCRVGGHSHIGGLAGKSMGQPIEINEGGKVTFVPSRCLIEFMMNLRTLSYFVRLPIP